MSKTNVQKLTNDLYSSSVELMEKIHGMRKEMNDHLQNLRKLEDRVRQAHQAEKAEMEAMAPVDGSQAAAAQDSVKPHADSVEAKPSMPEMTQVQESPKGENIPAVSSKQPLQKEERETAAPAQESTENRPARPQNDGERRYENRPPRPQGEGERPFTPRPQGEGDRPFTPRPQGEGERPYTPRPQGEGNRPYPPRTQGEGNRPYPPRTQGEGNRPYPPRQQGEGERPFTPRPQGEGDRPYTPRPQGGEGNRPYPPRTQGEGNRPYPPRTQGEGNRPYPPRQQGDGDRPYTPRPQGEGNRPYAPRPQGGEGNRPYAPRPAGQGGYGGAPRGGARPAGNANPLNPKMLAKELLPSVEKEKVSNYDPKKNTYQQEKDRERAAAKKSKKAIFMEAVVATPDEEDGPRGSRKHRGKKLPMKHIMMEKKIIDHAVIETEMVPIKVLAEKIGRPGTEIVKKLFLLGIKANINSDIEYDTAALVASDFNVSLEQKLAKSYEEVMIDEYDETTEKTIIRPPVVTVMGHVDHGKTSILDAIRQTKVTAGEAGGITQHIGAYTVDIHGRSITFLDTPGHEAFTSMRARGAQVTDIAILVVAADDGVMPQTVEAINHLKAAKVPMIVAINKMDLPAANPERVKQELTKYEILAEEWGGDTVMVPVSALTKEGLDQLLEMILLVADVQDLRATPDRLAKGTVVEARLDKGRGPIATILVQNGTLHVGDYVVAGSCSGRVRALNDHKGSRVEEAGPSTPVEVIGFADVPEAGDTMYSVDDEKLSKRVAEERREKQKTEQMKVFSRVTLDDLFSRISEGQMKEIKLIVKADVQGSAEAVKQGLEKLSNEEVRVVIIHSGVGAINANDIMLASTSNAIVIGFNIRPDANGREAAEREKVDIRMYRVIYSLIEDIQKAMKGMLAPRFKEVVQGHAEIRTTFSVSNVGTVAGCYVTNGKIQRGSLVRLLRDNAVINEGKLGSLKRFKDDAKEVLAGYECGLTIEGYNDIKEGDVVEAYRIEQIERT